jgi:hypothetical protein
MKNGKCSMKNRILAFSIALSLAFCSYGFNVYTISEPHKRMSEIIELLKKREDEDDIDD